MLNKFNILEDEFEIQQICHEKVENTISWINKTYGKILGRKIKGDRRKENVSNLHQKSGKAASERKEIQVPLKDNCFRRIHNNNNYV